MFNLFLNENRLLWTLFRKILIWDPDKEMILQLQKPKYRPNEKSDQNHSMQQICFQPDQNNNNKCLPKERKRALHITQ